MRLLSIGFVIIAHFVGQDVSAQHIEQSQSLNNHYFELQNSYNIGKAIFVEDLWSKTQISYHDSIKKYDIDRYLNDVSLTNSLFLTTINFRVSKSLVEAEYLSNAIEFRKMNQILANKSVADNLEYIIILAGSSPEGTRKFNEKLTIDRARAMKSYLMWRYPYLNRDIIYSFSIGENWDGLKKMIANDAKMPYRADVLEVLENVSDSDMKISRLKQIANGEAYRYISRNMFPKLRGATTVAFHLKQDEVIEPIEKPISEKTEVGYIENEKNEDNDIIKKEILPQEKKEENEIETGKEDVIEDKDIVDEKIIENETIQKDTANQFTDKLSKYRWPTIAFKTNLLFDAVSALNFEIEVPISKQWSIAGEYIFPWWLNENKQIALQNLTGTIEGRYWLSESIENNKLTGFFLGLYGGAGYYDVELKREKGYQGEFFHTGLSAGYVKPFVKNNNWRMEYSLGIGYLDTDFREYVAKYGLDNEWHLIRQRNGNTKYFGPTRAKVSVVWLLNNK